MTVSLELQTVDVKFTKGSDTRTQRKLVVPGKWDTLVNYALSEDNTPQRRDGVQPLVPTRDGNGLATYNAQLLAINGGYLYSVSTAPTVDAAISCPGRVGYVSISKQELERSTSNQDTPDCATGGGYTCYVWRELTAAMVVTSVNVMLVDETTGAQVIPSTSMRAAAIGTQPCARVVYSSGVFFIFYIIGTSLYCRTILTSSPTNLNVEIALITSVSLANFNFDACAFGTAAIGDTGSVMVVYGWADGVTSVRSIKVSIVAGLQAIAAGPLNLFTEAQLPIATNTGLACAVYSTGTLAACFATSTGAAAMAGCAAVTVTPAWAVGTAATQIDAAVAATFGNVHVTAVAYDSLLGIGMAVFWDREAEWAVNSLNPLKAAVTSTTLTAFLPANTFINSATFGAGINARGPKGPFIAGKAFNSNGTLFLPVFVGSTYNSLSPATANPRNANTQNSFFVLELLQDPAYNIQFNVVGKALYGSYGLASINGTAPGVCTPCSTPALAAGGFALCATELTLLVLASGNNVSPTGLVRLTMTPNTTVAPVKAQLGETTYLAGGSLTGYDGVAAAEVGFPLFPEGAAITVNGAGTGAMTAGVHQVVFIYEWVDNAGQRHQSAPSLPITVTVLATGSLTCQVPTLLLSEKGGGPTVATNIQVVAFMTQAGGLTFNRVLLNNGAFAPVMNSLAATTVTLTIDDSDATIAGNELLYNQPLKAGTTLANLAPGPCSFVWVAQNRLWFDKTDKPFWFGFSQEYQNNVGLQFAPELEDSLPSESGGFVAGAQLDEKVIIFGRDRIYAKYGTGPTASGGYNNYSRPIDIQSDVGCADPLSVLAGAPGGIVFKSNQGWHVVKRDLSVEYIGDGVSSYDAVRVSSAALMGDRKEARFTLATGGTLVYSTLIGEWSVFGYGSAFSWPVLDGLWWETLGRYVWIGTAANSGLNQDVPGVLTDTIGANAVDFFSTIARTAWLKVGALEGYQRVRWMYLTATAGTAPTSRLFITVDFDDVYGGTVTESFQVPLANITFPNTQAVDVRHKIVNQQKCKSIAFTFTDLPSTTQIPLSGIQALALEVGLKKGVNRLPAGQTV